MKQTSGVRPMAAVLLLGLTTAVACNDTPDVTEPEFSVVADAPVAFQNAPNLDVWIGEVAARVPGFAGFYFDESGTLVVKMTILANKPLLEPLMADVRAEFRYDGEIRAELADYRFEELTRLRDKMLRVGQDAGIVFIDIDERINRLVIAVSSARDSSVLEEALEESTSAYHIIAGASLSNQADLQDQATVRAGGLWINSPGLPAYGCTLGFNAEYQGREGFVTAAHCSSNIGIVDNEYWGQPNTFGNQLIAQEYADPAWSWYPGCPVLFGYQLPICRRSDAMFVEYDDTVTVSLGLIKKVTGEGSITIDPFQEHYQLHGGISGPGTGMDVWLTGAQNGQRSGEVVRTCILVVEQTVSLGYMTCQYTADYGGTNDGDSGGPVLHTYPNGQIVLVGIHKGSVTTPGLEFGNGVFSNYGQINQDFGYQLKVVPSPPPPSVDPPTSVDIDPVPNQVQPNDFCTWFGSAGGGDPPYTFTWYKGPTLVQTDVGTSTELSMDTGTADFVLKLVASNAGGSKQTTLNVDVTTSASPCFA